MLFTELMHAIHPHLMKDENVPSFTRNIIQMLCDIPEEDWYTKKDPSSDKNFRDESLRQYHNRGLSKKLAKAMLGRLTKTNFIESIYYPNRSDIVLSGLAKDIAPFCLDIEVNETNVAEVLFDLFHKSLELIVNPELENYRKIMNATSLSASLKVKLGSGLLDDCKCTCSMPLCSKHLQTIDNLNQSVSNYEIIKIDKKSNPKYENLLAVCHDCFYSYTLKHTAKETKALKAIKKLQSDSRISRNTFDEISIHKGIATVIENLINAKPKDIVSLNYDPVTVSEKIDENTYYFLKNEVVDNVVRYYQFIDTTMKSLSKNNTYSDDLVRSQIKEIYKKLENKKLIKEQIYHELASGIQRITKQDIKFCYIVVSYFIQSCEVFYATTE